MTTNINNVITIPNDWGAFKYICLCICRCTSIADINEFKTKIWIELPYSTVILSGSELN